jgi:phage-related protein
MDRVTKPSEIDRSQHPRHVARGLSDNRAVTPPGTTHVVYYRDPHGHEPVNAWLEGLLATKPAAAAKIDNSIGEHLNGRRAADPPPSFPITSQIDGCLRELRVRFANTRYRLLYQRSGNLLVLLHGFEKNIGAVPSDDKHTAQKRFADFRARMDAEPRQRPRAAGHDAPSRRGLER